MEERAFEYLFDDFHYFFCTHEIVKYELRAKLLEWAKFRVKLFQVPQLRRHVCNLLRHKERLSMGIHHIQETKQESRQVIIFLQDFSFIGRKAS